ncbi:protein of unknown function [Agrobacterium pusense]|uniref:Uncharacterized protein n=1 Tax=Agrobacterium pusense TaxID=648995 RepID=U4Q4Y9_9HYPH|nr:protein of unknown function [Agrobacterium pusense]
MLRLQSCREKILLDCISLWAHTPAPFGSWSIGLARYDVAPVSVVPELSSKGLPTANRIC